MVLLVNGPRLASDLFKQPEMLTFEQVRLRHVTTVFGAQLIGVLHRIDAKTWYQSKLVNDVRSI